VLLSRSLFLILVGFSLAPSLALSQSFWGGDSGGHHIYWGGTDLVATNAATKNTGFSAQIQADNAWRNLTRNRGDGTCSAEFGYTLASVVGPIMSFRQEEKFTCGKFASWSNGLMAINLNKSTEGNPAPAHLSDYFPETALLFALLSDSTIKTVIGEAEPKSLKELAGILIEHGMFLRNHCSYSFASAFLDHFGFYDARPAAVDVRIALSPTKGTCPGKLVELNLELPLSNSPLQTAITSAKGEHHGILTKGLHEGGYKSFETFIRYPRPH